MKLPLKVSLSVTLAGAMFMLFLFDNIHQQLSQSQQDYIVQNSIKELEQLENSLNLILNKSVGTITTMAITNKNVKNTILKQKIRFNYYMKDNNELQHLKYISLEGKELLSISRDTMLDKKSKKNHKESILFTKALEQAFYIGDLYFDKKTHKIMIDIAKAVNDISDNKIDGVIIATISVSEIQELISDKLISFDAIALLDKNNNRFLYKSSYAKIFEEKDLVDLNGVQTSFSYKDKLHLIVTDNYKKNNLNLKFYLITKEETLYKQIQSTIESNLKLFTLILFIFAIVVYIIILNILTPLEKLAIEIKKQSLKYDKNIKDEEIKDFNEVESLHFYFRTFINLIKKDRSKLSEFNKNLQKKIDDEVEKNKLSQELLMQQTKMASMGEMLESIAHQWRQPLSVITTSATGIKVQKDYGLLTDELLFTSCDNITQNAEHLSQTIDDFRDFYKEDKIKKLFNIKETVNATLALLVTKFKHKEIEVIKNIENLEYTGLKNELIQVLMNIISNSKDELELKDQKRYIFIEIQKVDQNIIINIKDNAGGIPENVLPKIFNARFTTKSDRDGTGIGLFMSKKIIESSFKGTLEASNVEYTYNGEKYKGASFIITIPADQ
ncbi:MAG: sensor histidine kinase [Campylobacterota bacterium]|nr:sensor histidine kinase [Campylobacterota bacterium]